MWYLWQRPRMPWERRWWLLAMMIFGSVVILVCLYLLWSLDMACGRLINEVLNMNDQTRLRLIKSAVDGRVNGFLNELQFVMIVEALVDPFKDCVTPWIKETLARLQERYPANP